MQNYIVEKENLWLDTGTMFGVEGQRFERINVATSRGYLEKAMNSLYDAYKDVE